MSSNFNTRPLVLFAGGAIYIVFTLLVFRALMGGDLVKAAMLLGVAGGCLFHLLRQWWMGILFASLCFYGLNLPIPFLGTLGLFGAVAVLIVAYFFIDTAMKKGGLFIRRRGYYICFFICAALIAARVAYDRPGFANFGSREGGIGMAVNYFIGMLAFAIAYYATRSSKNYAFNFKLIVFGSFVAFVFVEIFIKRVLGRGNAALDFSESESSSYALSFNRQLYFFFAALLLFGLQKNIQRILGPVFFVFSIGLVIVLAATSGVRSAIFQSPAMAVTSGFLYRRGTLAFFTSFGSGVIGLVALVAFVPYKDLPMNIQRPLSMVLTGQEEKAGYGTKDEFRDALHGYAQKRIAESPIVGIGWSFDVSQMMSAMSSSNSVETGMLTMGLAFHNCFYNLAVANGLPLPVIYLLGVLWGVLSLFRFAREQRNPQIKYQISFFLIYVSSVGIMFFVNGGTYEVFAISAALGAASALRDMAEREPSEYTNLRASAGEPPNLS